MAEVAEAKILCVDDEPNLLAALERSLSEFYDVTIAVGGKAGLEALKTKGPYAVVVSDMRMPEMDGATFLGHVHDRYPDSVRILLTGQADTESAIEAINKGAIFRYLCKPCPQDLLRKTLDEAISQHRLVIAERELLATTLTASVKTLTEVLSIAAPWAFRRAAFAQGCVRHALKKLGWSQPWMYEVAAALSQIGCVGIPAETVQRDAAQRPLTPEDAKLMAEHPEVAYRLIGAIPRLGRVADIIRYQNVVPPAGSAPEVQRGAELLRAALTLEREVTRGRAVGRVPTRLEQVRPPISSHVIAALADFQGDLGDVRAAQIKELVPGWVLDEDLYTTSGTLLLSKGHELTDAAIVALRRFHAANALEEPVYVRSRAEQPKSETAAAG